MAPPNRSISAPDVSNHSNNNSIISSGPGRATLFVPLKRHNSFPANSSNVCCVLRLRSIMRVSSLDESLHVGDIKRTRTRSMGSGEISDRPVTILFTVIKIREYEQAIGDNPSCSSGPPIGLGWNYRDCKDIPLDSFESRRAPRRSHFEMLIPRERRHHILMKEWEIPRREVAAAVRENVKTKNQRVRTISNLSSERMENVLESAKRKLMRTLFFKKRPSTEYKEMMKQADKAAASVARVASNGRVLDCVPRRYSNPSPAREKDEVLDVNMSRHSTGGGAGLGYPLMPKPAATAQ